MKCPLVHQSFWFSTWCVRKVMFSLPDVFTCMYMNYLNFRKSTWAQLFAHQNDPWHCVIFCYIDFCSIFCSLDIYLTWFWFGLAILELLLTFAPIWLQGWLWVWCCFWKLFSGMVFYALIVIVAFMNFFSRMEMIYKKLYSKRDGNHFHLT